MLQFENTLSPLSTKILDFAGKLCLKIQFRLTCSFFPKLWIPDALMVTQWKSVILRTPVKFFELIILHTAFYMYIKKKTKTPNAVDQMTAICTLAAASHLWVTDTDI